MRTCVLTFDDGFRSHFDFVRPMLKEYCFTGTFFISGSFVSAHDRKPVKVGGYATNSITEFMTWDEIKVMHDDGFEIGNHLMKHVDMRRIRRSKALVYFSDLDKKLESIGVTRTRTIAYPSFFVDTGISKVAEDYGFKFGRSGCAKTRNHDDYQFGGLGSGYGLGDDRFDINCTFVFGQKYRADDFIRDIVDIPEGEIIIFCFHDFGSSGLSVNLPADDFLKILRYLRANKFQTINLRDLDQAFCGNALLVKESENFYTASPVLKKPWWKFWR